MSTSSQAFVTTDSPARYGKQLASHFGHKMTTSWDPATECGTLLFDNPELPVSGSCTLAAEPGGLRLCVTASEADALAAVERVVAVHLLRFGQREGLECQWTRDVGGGGRDIHNGGCGKICSGEGSTSVCTVIKTVDERSIVVRS